MNRLFLSLIIICLCCACTLQSEAAVATGVCTESSQSDLMKRAYEGDSEAAVWLAMSYELGFCGSQSSEMAAVWYSVASEHGDVFSMYRLASLHLEADKNMDRETKERVLGLLERSADAGIKGAMVRMANLYLTGSLGRKDLTLAYLWFARANCTNLKGKGNFDEVLLSKMTNSQLKEAKSLLKKDYSLYCSPEGMGNSN